MQTLLHTPALTSPALSYRCHQLKDWLLLPPVHLFPALRINSCQRTPPSDSRAPANPDVSAAFSFWLTHPTWSLQRISQSTGSLVDEARSCQPLVVYNKSLPLHVFIMSDITIGVSGHSAEIYILM